MTQFKNNKLQLNALIYVIIKIKKNQYLEEFIVKTLTAVLIGAGMRGNIYATEMKKMGDKYKIVAVADSVEVRRNSIKDMFDIPEENCYATWEDVLSQPKMADIAIIATMDDMHYEPAMKAIELGYNLLLEKPVAQTAQECVDIALAAEKKGVKVLVCHVLRYTDFFGKIKQIVMDGTIGDIMSIIQVEGVGNLHHSHSYVRGNWHSESESAPMLLAKCCHDIDIIQWLFDKPCSKVQSFGELTYFTDKNAPEGAPVRCADSYCPARENCPYDCIKYYVDDKNRVLGRQACAGKIAKTEIPTDEEVLTALKTTDYGLCVFHANNDVVDHQTVNMIFDGGGTANLIMNAFNEEGRYIRVFGTKGELYARMADTEITVYTFDDMQRKTVNVAETVESIVGGHGGGDVGIIREMYEYMTDSYNGYRAANIDVSVKNHLIGFAAEKSRNFDTVESIDKFFNEYGIKNN